MLQRRFEASEKVVETEAEQEGEKDFGDEDAGEEKDSGGGEGGETGVEGGSRAEGLVGPAIAEQREQKDSES